MLDVGAVFQTPEKVVFVPVANLILGFLDMLLFLEGKSSQPVNRVPKIYNYVALSVVVEGPYEWFLCLLNFLLQRFT